MEMRISKTQLVLVIIVAAIFIMFATSALLQDTFYHITNNLQTFVEHNKVLGPIIFILLAAASVLLGPFTSAPLVPSAVIIWGTGLTLGFLILGWLLGNTLAYGVGYYFGYPLVKKLLPDNKVEEWITLLSENVDIWLAFLFRLATPSETGYVFGTLKYNFLKYFTITLIAELPFAVVTVYAGEAFINTGWLSFVGLGILWAIFILVAVSMFRRKVKKVKQKTLKK